MPIAELRIPKPFAELLQPHRYHVYYGGRGAAKSQTVAMILIAKAISKNVRILCARELQVSIADSVHRLLADTIEMMGVGDYFEVQKAAIYGVNGSEFIFKGLKHNVGEIKSLAGVDICFVEEAEKVSSGSWEVLIPTIRKEGSEFIIIFNPKHPTDATYQRFVAHPPEDSFVQKVSWRDNPFFPKVLDMERRDMEKRDPEAYQHIWEGEFDTRYSGAVYAKWVARLQERGLVTERVEHDPEYPVYTAWDLGYDDTTAIWFYQIAPGEIVVIDCYESNREDIRHYCEILYGRELVPTERDVATGVVRGFKFGADLEDGAHRKAYRYGAHFVPQDAGKKVLEAGGRSTIEQALRDWGIRMTVMKETTHHNRIEAARKTLPVCWFHPRCRDGLDALLYYHFDYDEDKQSFSRNPVHDWSSNYSTSFEILARAWQDKTKTLKQYDAEAKERRFFRLRSEAGVDSVDPYRLRKKV